MDVTEHNADSGYHMGVYLCLGQPAFGLKHHHSTPFSEHGSFNVIHQKMSVEGKVFVFLGEGKHKIKKKAEQMACESALINIR